MAIQTSVLRPGHALQLTQWPGPENRTQETDCRTRLSLTTKASCKGGSKTPEVPLLIVQAGPALAATLHRGLRQNPRAPGGLGKFKGGKVRGFIFCLIGNGSVAYDRKLRPIAAPNNEMG